MSASHLSMQYGLRGPCLTFSTACSSSAVAVGEAFRQIKDGYADVMLAGGTESLLGLAIIMSWQSIGTLAREVEDPSTSCRPFSLDRTGFVLGKGSAIVVLEEMERAKARGAHIYGELAGYGSTADATHITRPFIEGQARAISLALSDEISGPQT
uniref:beta-ketoacyl synthase N-terminal-like domain-containing protein n=1 Tax=Dissulfurimicrobium sp. TaxID=2022436 RepID=UPI00404B51AD